MAVVSFVSARVDPKRHGDVVEPYEAAVSVGLPPGIRQTFLLVGDDGTLAIATLWESREALDAMLASGQEPLARRLLREAGGEPSASFFDVAVEAASGERG